MFRWQKLLMDDLESITDCIILPFKGSKASKNRVINTFDKNDFFKRIVILDSIVLLGPSGDSLFTSRNIGSWIATCWLSTLQEGVSDVFHDSLLSLWITRISQNTIFIHEI